MVGAVDFSGGNAANVDDVDLLNNGEKYFSNIMNGSATTDLYVKQFIVSDYNAADGAATNIEGINYDRTLFEKDGSKLSSSIPQVLKAYNTSQDKNSSEYILDKNAFATPSTKFSDVAYVPEILPSTIPKTYSLDGTQLKLTGKNVGGAAYDVTIDLKSSANNGSTFTIGGNSYDIFDMSNPRAAVDADEMTYQQLMDVVNMAVTNNIPAGNSASEFDAAIESSSYSGKTFLNYDGRVQFQEIGVIETKAEIALYDANTDNFTKNASVATFNSNNALTIRDPKTDFFKELDEIITSVEDHKINPDASSGHIRNVGIENSITKLDDLFDHIGRSHSIVGSQSNALTASLERTAVLEISTMTLRSSVIDTDMAEASLTLTQLSLNYEAMLSTVGRISKLSLVNYL